MGEGIRRGIDEDLEHDPTFARQRLGARVMIGMAVNRLRGREFFENDHFTNSRLGDEIARVAIEIGIVTFDDLKHAPKCPANHFHKARLPTGPCNCGARR